MPSELFLDPDKPIHLDIGSARGDFLLEMAEQNKYCNFLGLEIRQALVKSSNVDVDQRRLNNVRFLFCNANISLQDWLLKIPNKLIQVVSIQFPDPWFKRKHYKRRLLQPGLLIALSDKLSYGSKLFIQSDVLEVLEQMMQLIEYTYCFESDISNRDLLSFENPFPSRTAREKYVISNGLPIYRMLYTRNDKVGPKLNEFINLINDNSDINKSLYIRSSIMRD
tara:strand:- start:80 stop:748 length:669 start_codon:yes stop_codon:yes gene_type:complete